MPDSITAAQTGVACYDCSTWGRIQLSDTDCLNFLHNQSTNNLKQLRAGQGCDTVIVNSTARTLDLVTAWVLEAAVLLLVSPNRRAFLLQWLDRYIFFNDKVKLTDVTEATVAYRLIGPESAALLQSLGLGLPTTAQPGDHQLLEFQGKDIRVAQGSGLALPGFTLIAPKEAAPILEAALQPATVLDAAGWEQLRVLQGRPQPDQELTEDYNPLEAGLWQMISFNKGCYIGQETIARLNTYQGVKQQLWGLKLTTPVPAGTLITQDEQKIGEVTSCIPTATGAFALGYIKTKAGGAGLTPQVGDQQAEVTEVPFLSRQPQEEKSG
jgi:tRNA-modifying protein YgfZ